MYPDHEFDPITPEEEAPCREAEFARRVRREVRRTNGARPRRRSAPIWSARPREGRSRGTRAGSAAAASQYLLAAFSGTILVREGVSKYYPYMLSIAGMFS